MFRRLGLLCAALALFSIAGGHWAVLQTVAWAEMLHDYTQRNGSFTVAIAQTFDGQHPCELCRTIAAAKSKSHDPSPAASSLKDDVKAKALLAGPVNGPVINQAPGINLPRLVSILGPGRMEAPPTPPPRPSVRAV